MDVLGISGSLRRHSTNNALLGAFADEAPQGVWLDVYRRLGDLPIFNPDDEGERSPEAAGDLIDRVQQADGLVIACPEYAHGVPGGLKNALDWLVSREAAVDKPVMLIHASTRSAVSRSALQEILRTMNMRLFPGPELEIRLIGLTPESWPGVLGADENRARMRRCWRDFGAFLRAG